MLKINPSKHEVHSALIDNDTCLKKTELEEKKNYFKDETTNRYISCSIMDNCNTFDSRTECTSCLDGFFLSNNLCNKINNDNNDDGLGTGAIIGIVFGAVGFLLIVILTGYYLIKKVFNKNNGNNRLKLLKVQIQQHQILYLL